MIILIHGCVTEVISIAMYCTNFRSSSSSFLEDIRLPCQFLTYKESGLNGHKNRDVSSDF